MPKRSHHNSAAFNRKLIATAVAACFSVNSALANPTAPTVVHGTASFAQAGSILNVTNSHNAIINWGSFSIGVNELTRFIQPSALSAVLNRVVGQDPSAILGALQSNGRVFLINPNGIVFGAGAQINVAGLVASTLNLSNDDFLNNRMRFTDGAGAGSVVNQGSITGGNVYLVGNAVTNNGLITSPNGEVVLAAGNSVELVNPGTPNLRVEIVAADNQARNLGQIVADSGRIGIYAGLINHSGTLRADTVEVGKNGEILLKANKNIALESGSVISASGAPGGVHDGGTVRIVAEDTLDMQRGSAVHVDGGIDGGNGGFLELSGKQQIALNGEFTGRARKDGYQHGSLLLDPLNINIGALGITTTISLASGPGSIAVKQDGTRVYVVRPSSATFGSDFIEVIDTSSNVIIATINLGDGTNATVSSMALSPDGSKLYAVFGNTGANPGYIKVVDTATNSVATTYGVSGPTNLFGPVVDSSNRIYTAGNVPFAGGAQMVVIDGATGTQLGAVAVEFNPQQIVVNPSGTRVYVTSISPNVVLQEFATGTNALLSSTALAARPTHQAISSDGATLYLAYGNRIEVRSTSSLAAVADTIPVGADRLVVNGSSAYASLNGSVSVVDLSTKTARQTFAIGASGSSQGLGFNAANNSVYATPPTGNQLAVIGLNSGTDTTTGGVILHTDAPSSTLNLPVSALNGAWSNVNLAATNNVSVNSPLLDSSVPSGGTLTLTAGNDVNVNAWIGESGARFNHALTLVAGNNININSSIYQGNQPLVLAADAAIPAQGITPNGIGNVNIKALGAPVTVDTLGGMTVSGKDFNVLASKSAGVMVNVGGLLDASLTGNFLLQGGKGINAQAGSNIDASATIQANAINIAAAGTITVAGGDSNGVYASGPGTNSASINANATLSATTSINLSGTAITIRGGDYNSGYAYGGNNSVAVNANALVSAGTDITLTGTSLTVRGGNGTSASASGIGNNMATVTANAALTAGQAMSLSVAGPVLIAGGNDASASASSGNNVATINTSAMVTAGTTLALTANSLTVRGGDYASASASSIGNNVATVNANAALTAGQAMSLTVAGPVVIAGGYYAEASAYSGGDNNVSTVNANASVTAGTTLALTATSLTVQGGDYASASIYGVGNNTATTNANASLVSGGNMSLTATSGGILIRGGDGGSATASSGGINNATTNANALVSSGGLLTLNATGGLTVRGGNNGSASASDAGRNTAVLNTNASVLADTMNLTVAGPVLIQGGSNASAEASCCADVNTINSATINTNAVVRANNGLTLTVTGGSVTIAGGDYSGAEGSEASGQFIAVVNAKGELSTVAGPLTVGVTGGSLTVRGGNYAYASASASSNFAQVNATTAAPGMLVSGGNLSINTTGGVTIRGGDYASASADGTGVGTRAVANVNADAVVAAAGSITVTTPSLNVMGGNFAYADAYDWGQNSAVVTANAFLAAGTDLMLTVAGGIMVAGGGNAMVYAAGGSAAGILNASASAGALVSAGGMASINAGSLTIAGGIQSSASYSYGAFASGPGTTTATTLANANIATTGDFSYTGGTVTLMGGVARAQGGAGVNAAAAEANAGTQIAGAKTMNISGNLQILGGSAYDDGLDAANGFAMARAVLDPGAMTISTLGDVMVTGGSVTGSGSAYSTMMALGPISLTIAGSTGLTLTGGGSTGLSADLGSPITVTYTGGGTQNIVINPLLDSAGVLTAPFVAPPLPPVVGALPDALEVANQILVTSVQESGTTLETQQTALETGPIDKDEKKKEKASMVCR